MGKLGCKQIATKLYVDYIFLFFYALLFWKEGMAM